MGLQRTRVNEDETPKQLRGRVIRNGVVFGLLGPLMLLLVGNVHPMMVPENNNVDRQKETKQAEKLTTDPTSHRNLLLEYLPWYWSKNCPPPGFDALHTFDIDSYISALWYPIKAAPVIYAQGQSYCSVVQYTTDDSCWFFCGNNPRIHVRNRGRVGGVDGPVNGAGFLRAFVPKTNEPAKLKVSGPQRFVWWTNYWVVAAGTYEDALSPDTLQPQPTGTNYDWALISGAAPFRETSNGKCIPGIGVFDTRGLWMFARHPNPPDGVVDNVQALAESMGLDTSQWFTTIHEGCTYPSF